MKAQFKIILILCFSIFLLPFTIQGKTSDSVNINLQVTGTCNTNNICESDLGESENSCSADCGCNNNGSCEANRNEDVQNCLSDCRIISPETNNSGGGGSITFQIKNFIIGNITTNSVNISWLTTQFSLCQFFWGKTSEYKKETISETNFATGHSIQLKNLDSASIYHFEITCVDGQNEKDQTQDQQFQTLTALNNVINFTATPGDAKINLSWVNPPDANFYGVKILRKNDFYPLNVNDGTIIYEGSGNFFEDSSLVNGKTYHYTIFTENSNGNFSSGAIVFAAPYKKNTTPIQPVLPIKPVNPENPPVNQVQAKKITIDDFNFSIGGANIPLKDNKTIEVIEKSSLNISIDCTKLSDAKTVLVDLQDKQKTYSFILKPEGEKNSCNVSLIVSQNPGNYSFKILIINSNNKIISQINAELKVLSENKLSNFPVLSLYILISLIVIIFILFLIIKKRAR